jgi:outer membrane lipoprotein carrier protein
MWTIKSALLLFTILTLSKPAPERVPVNDIGFSAKDSFAPQSVNHNLNVAQIQQAPVSMPIRDARLDNTIAKMQKQYEATTSFRADFTQRYTYTILRKTQESTGTAAYMKPGRIRWDYSTPQKKSFIVNEGKLWVDQPEDQLVMVDHCFKQDSLTASLSFLWGAGKLREQFRVQWFEGVFGSKEDLHLLLIPLKPQNLFSKLILVLDQSTYRVKQSIVVDPQGNINQFIYRNAAYNKKVKAKDFRFRPSSSAHVSRMPGSCPAK